MATLHILVASILTLALASYGVALAALGEPLLGYGLLACGFGFGVVRWIAHRPYWPH